MFFFDLTSERALPPPAKVPKREPGAAAGAAIIRTRQVARAQTDLEGFISSPLRHQSWPRGPEHTSAIGSGTAVHSSS